MRSHHFIFVLLLISGCSHISEPAFSPIRGDYSHVQEYAEKTSSLLLDKQGITGLSIAIVDNQDIIWSKGLGYANLEQGHKANINTLYRTGSISKIFSMATVLKLQENKVLNLDDKIVRHLPQLIMADHQIKEVTYRAILSHHSGLPTSLLNGMWYTEKSKPALLSYLKNDYLAFTPNTLYCYSNLAYSLLGLAIEQKGNKPFQQQVQSLILHPLAMNRSTFTHTMIKDDNFAQPYNTSRQLAPYYHLRDIGAGGLVSSVTELSHFVKMLFAEGRYIGNQVLSQDSIQQMFSKQNDGISLDFGVETGLAWFLNQSDLHISGTVAVVFGSTINYSGVVLLSVEHKVAVILLANTPAQLGEFAYDLLYKTVHAKNASKDPFVPKTNPMQHTDIPLGISYWSSHHGLITLINNGDKPYAIFNEEKLAVFQDKYGYWRILPKMIGLIPYEGGPFSQTYFSFHLVSQEQVMLSHGGGKQFLFASRVLAKPISQKWLDRLGSYQLVSNQAAVYLDQVSLHQQKELLLLSYSVMPMNKSEAIHLPVVPVDDKRAVIAGLGRGRGNSLLFSTQQNQIYFQYQGYRFKKIHPN